MGFSSCLLPLYIHSLLCYLIGNLSAPQVCMGSWFDIALTLFFLTASERCPPSFLVCAHFNNQPRFVESSLAIVADHSSGVGSVVLVKPDMQFLLYRMLMVVIWKSQLCCFLGRWESPPTGFQLSVGWMLKWGAGHIVKWLRIMKLASKLLSEIILSSYHLIWGCHKVSKDQCFRSKLSRLKAYQEV